MARRDYFQQAQKRRYRSHAYRNPHLDGRKPFPWKRLGFIVGVLVLGLGGIAGIFGHDVFRIDRIEILGVKYLDKAMLESVISTHLHDTRLLFFERSNQFLFSPDELSQLLEEQFALASISIGLQEGTVFIVLEERTSNLFWKTQEKLYVVDLEGIVVREVVDSDDSILQQANLAELPIFIDTNDVSVQVGSFVLTAEEIERAFVFFDHLKEAGIKYAYIELDRLAGKWVKLVTEQGFSIFVDLTGDVDEQYKNLSIVLQEQVGDPSTLEYIDLRFGDKVYVK
ncbi:hypothetical protein EPN81_03630 [Patescibacteria group bacterium]|nr:MAG: hypothetical protein EPN81_03630 [Patescibacteria group bacterium]